MLFPLVEPIGILDLMPFDLLDGFVTQVVGLERVKNLVLNALVIEPLVEVADDMYLVRIFL